MRIEDQKNIANAVMYKLEAIDPYCILAGGAPRDWYLGREASDLDFYLCVPDRETQSAFESRLRRVGLSFDIAFKDSGLANMEVYKNMPGIKGIYNLTGFGMPIQVMRMRDPTFKSVVHEFGTSVCMAWYKDGKVKTTKVFEWSHENKIIIKKSDYNAKVKHVAKMREKFPDYRVVSGRWLNSRPVEGKF